MNSPLHLYFHTMRDDRVFQYSEDEMVLVADSARVLPANRSLTRRGSSGAIMEKDDRTMMLQVRRRNNNNNRSSVKKPSPSPPPPALLSSRWSPPRPSGRKMWSSKNNNTSQRRQDTALQQVTRLTSPRTPNERKTVLTSAQISSTFKSLPFAPMSSPTMEISTTRQQGEQQEERTPTITNNKAIIIAGKQTQHDLHTTMLPTKLGSPTSVTCDTTSIEELLQDKQVAKEDLQLVEGETAAADGTTGGFVGWPRPRRTRISSTSPAPGAGYSSDRRQFWDNLEHSWLIDHRSDDC